MEEEQKEKEEKKGKQIAAAVVVVAGNLWIHWKTLKFVGRFEMLHGGGQGKFQVTKPAAMEAACCRRKSKLGPKPPGRPFPSKNKRCTWRVYVCAICTH
jgi:hypothetical protein